MSNIDSDQDCAAAKAAKRELVRQRQKADAPVAMAEYRAAQEAVRQRTRQLREQRMAREAASE